MATTYTLHSVSCGSAAEAPVASASDYPGARWHRCAYYTDPKPEQVRVTFVDEIVPEAGEKDSPGAVEALE